MRRSDLQLLSLVRQGDPIARLEAGRRYLRGGDGFPKNIRTGIDYLTHSSVRDRSEAIEAICQSLALHEILEHGLCETLARGADRNCAAAQFKLGVWKLTRKAQEADALSLLRHAASSGHLPSSRVIERACEGTGGMAAALGLFSNSGAIDGGAVALLAAREALGEEDLDRLCQCLQCASSLSPDRPGAIAELTVAALKLAAELARPLAHLKAEQIQAALQTMVDLGDMKATYYLGCALAGIDCGVAGVSLVRSLNLRAGVALLLRAADGGEVHAWFDLYRLVADHESPVANAQMSQFFLEKAAAAGNIAAQRILGGLLLSKTSTLKDSERAIHWLYQSANRGDALAKQLLQTLILPIEGAIEHAQAVADAVRTFDPLLASRLMLARHFGLTKLEALVVNPVVGLRPWGLVVERNPFIVQGRLSAPRAVPAVTTEALRTAVAAADLFAHAQRDALGTDGNLRQRAGRLRSACDRFGLDEMMFFASASSTQLDRHRLGPKWAFRVRETLQFALETEHLLQSRHLRTTKVSSPVGALHAA
jgi:TPR repeat protein